MARVVVYQYSWDQHWQKQQQQQRRQRTCNYLIELEFEIRDFAENVIFFRKLIMAHMLHIVTLGLARGNTIRNDK